MTEKTRMRALNALTVARTTSTERYLFPRVFVCGEHVYFNFMSALRQQDEYQYIWGKIVEIEVVNTPYKDFVNWDENQRGTVVGELFPNEKYEALINS